jgi:hypothetical protein
MSKKAQKTDCLKISEGFKVAFILRVRLFSLVSNLLCVSLAILRPFLGVNVETIEISIYENIPIP